MSGEKTTEAVVDAGTQSSGALPTSDSSLLLTIRRCPWWKGPERYTVTILREDPETPWTRAISTVCCERRAIKGEISRFRRRFRGSRRRATESCT